MSERVVLIVGGGLFGSLAATYARSRGLEARVFDPGLAGAASPAAAGLFCEAWAGRKLATVYREAVPVLERSYEVRSLVFHRTDGKTESLLFVPPRQILEPEPIRQQVTAVGDGWLEAAGVRHLGWVYVAAGVWCGRILSGITVTGKAGAAFVFPGEGLNRVHHIEWGRHALAFVRDAGFTYFNDGTAEDDYTDLHDRATLERAAALGLTAPPRQRLWGIRPYAPGGPLFRQVAPRTWVATGGRKMGLIIGAAFARRLVEDEIG